MTPKAPLCFLFPHTTLSERDYRSVCVLLPRLFLLQVARPPAPPRWAADRVFAWPAVPEEQERERIIQYLKSYEYYADLYGEQGNLAAMSLHKGGNLGESRLKIESALKGKTHQDPDLEKTLLLEAALFLEMARDLDEREMELEGTFARIGKLEDEFRTILGITGEEEVDEAAETLSPPLAPGKADLSFMLSRRIALWLRLFSFNPPDAQPVLVATCPEVVDEVIDALRGRYEGAGRSLDSESMTLAAIPDLSAAAAEDFESFLSDPSEADVLESCRTAMENALGRPGTPEYLDVLAERADALRRRLNRLCSETSPVPPAPIEIVLTRIEAFSLDELHLSVDRQGHGAWGEKTVMKQAPVSVLSIRHRS